MEKVFCEEKIKKDYCNRHINDKDYEENLLLDYYQDMAIHICGKARLVFETDHYYISVQIDGVYKINNEGPVSSIAEEGEFIEEYAPYDYDSEEDDWTDYETLMFTGERLTEVKQNVEVWILVFDDFLFTLIPHISGETFPRNVAYDFCRVHGTERFIHKCDCGGTGNLYLDNVSDYYVECDKCGKSTWAWPVASDAIEQWNDQDDLISSDGQYPEQAQKEYVGRKADNIVISERPDRMTKDEIDCENVIFHVDDRKFSVSSRYAGSGNYDFLFTEFLDYNPAIWPYRVIPDGNDPIIYAGKKTDNDGKSFLEFEIGSQRLRIISKKFGLTIQLPENVTVTQE